MPTESSVALWNDVWANAAAGDFWWWVERETHGVRGDRIRNFLETNLGPVSSLRFIEVGSGAGSASLAFARLGADVTLLDYTEAALDLARANFARAGLKARFIQADAFQPDDRLMGNYDVAMSFGTIEHFETPRRRALAARHVDFVRPGGVVAISVPHRRFFPHEMLKRNLEKRGRWRLGLEHAHSKKELVDLARDVGLTRLEIYGSGVRTDFRRYLSVYANTATLRRWTPDSMRTLPAPSDVPSRWDDVLGADIFVLGIRPAGTV